MFLGKFSSRETPRSLRAPSPLRGSLVSLSIVGEGMATHKLNPAEHSDLDLVLVL